MKKISKYLFHLTLFIWAFSATAQCKKGDCQNGWGIYMFSNGDGYFGKFKNGKRDGLGVYSFGGDLIQYYVGQWQEDEKHGTGYYTRGNTLQLAEWRNGNLMGKSIYFDSYGNCYTALYYNGQKMSEQFYQSCYEQLIDATNKRDEYLRLVRVNTNF